MRLRDEMYFEPRVISESGRLRWFGYSYSHNALLNYAEQTVYVRDNVKEILVYVLNDDSVDQAKFKLIATIEKKDQRSCYGNYFGTRDTDAEKEIVEKIEQCKADIESTSSAMRKRDLTKYLKRLNRELKRIRRHAA